ncbi:hypothetical protein FJZ53_01625 [Candidatus Woesearchaeota archaeon]|nr:hypothetical protein [Candidatus Woesearchaeota archaeon]
MVKTVSNEPPTSEVMGLRSQNRSNSDIIRELSQRGYSNQQIYEAINQADIKGGIEGTIPSQNMGGSDMMQPSALSNDLGESEIPIPVPSPQVEENIEGGVPAHEMPAPVSAHQQSQSFMASPSPQGFMDIESVQEIVEAIIDERWQEIVSSVGDITLWKGKMEDDIASIKQEVLRIEDRFMQLQASIIGKVDDYHRSINQVSSEMAALEKVFGKIMEPLTSNIKELQRLTQDMKKVSSKEIYS